MTYSLVAFDPDTGECGVAVQSHWFSVGSLVTWAEPGVGAVASQANVDPGYGPRGLALMAAGLSAPEALAELTAADGSRASRQVAMVDVDGGVAAHTGGECMSFAGQAVGRHHSAQANVMRTEAVWGAMVEAYEASSGTLAARLLESLDAGEAAGGDVRGRQSAAILVAPAAGDPWDRVVDVRVEDHPEPLVELRRLVGLNAAYAVAGAGDELSGAGDLDGAGEKYVEAWELAPEMVELRFWAGLSLLGRGETERGEGLLRAVVAEDAGWGELLAKLGPRDGPGVEAARRLDLAG